MSEACHRCVTRVVLVVVSLIAGAAVARAQTTVSLPAVTWGTVRDGASANTFQGDLLATSTTGVVNDTRRALLKFDTDTRVPAGAVVTSATLKVTVSFTSTGSARRVAAYQVTDSFGDRDFSWNYRRISQGQRWTTPGGDLGTQAGVQTVGNIVGTTISYDVTSLVRAVVAGQFGTSRYTRIALVDIDPASTSSLREYATPTAATAASRPTLTVTYGTTTAATVPNFTRIFMIVMENKEYSQIIGNAAAPFINQLAAQHGLATNFTAVTHPSLPNYMALTGGQTVFTTDCQGCTTTGRNIVDSVADSGRHWKAYMESMPLACDKTDSGLYAQKHNPFVHYTDIVGNTPRCTSKVVPLTTFDSDLQNGTLPNFVWITPNMCHDMHDCSIAAGDLWLSQFVPRITSSSAFTNAMLIVVWDEGTTTTGGGGQVPVIVVSARTPAGTKVTTAYNHYNLLATIEQAWSLPRLGKSAGVPAMTQFFK